MERALVVDDDPAVADFLVTVLESMGFAVDLAANAEDGAFLLRMTRYDILFLDVELPVTSGLVLLQLVKKRGGQVQPPRHVVVIRSSPTLSALERDEPHPRAHLLPKPFAAADVRAAVHRLMPRTADATRPVVILGAGLWADALARVVTARDGAVVRCGDVAAFSYLVRNIMPLAIVAGPPLPDRDYVRAVAIANEIAGNATRIPIFAGIRASHPTLRGDLQAIGVRGVYALPTDVAGLSDAVLRWTALRRRADVRESVTAAALLRSSTRPHAAMLVDVSASGAGFDAVPASVAHVVETAEIHLEGMEPVVIPARTRWVAPSRRDEGRLQVGVRFETRVPVLECWIASRRVRSAIDDYVLGSTGTA